MVYESINRVTKEVENVFFKSVFASNCNVTNPVAAGSISLFFPNLTVNHSGSYYIGFMDGSKSSAEPRTKSFGITQPINLEISDEQSKTEL